MCLAYMIQGTMFFWCAQGPVVLVTFLPPLMQETLSSEGWDLMEITNLHYLFIISDCISLHSFAYASRIRWWLYTTLIYNYSRISLEIILLYCLFVFFPFFKTSFTLDIWTMQSLVHGYSNTARHEFLLMEWFLCQKGIWREGYWKRSRNMDTNSVTVYLNYNLFYILCIKS